MRTMPNPKLRRNFLIVQGVLIVALAALFGTRAYLHAHYKPEPVWSGPQPTSATIMGDGSRIVWCDSGDGHHFRPRGNTCYSADEYTRPYYGPE